MILLNPGPIHARTQSENILESKFQSGITFQMSFNNQPKFECTNCLYLKIFKKVCLVKIDLEYNFRL